jgi:hypothetical protein
MAMSKTAFSTLCLLSCVVGDLFDGLSGLGYGLFVGLSFALVGLVLSKLRQSFGDSESKTLPYKLPTLAFKKGQKVSWQSLKGLCSATVFSEGERNGRVFVEFDEPSIKLHDLILAWIPKGELIRDEESFDGFARGGGLKALSTVVAQAEAEAEAAAAAKGKAANIM